MIALFFEVRPKPQQDAAYFQMAAALKPALEASGGLLFLDRSKSADRPGWFLSHQFWTCDDAMTRWRTDKAHHRAQVCGRTDILADYRLRVGAVIASVTGDGEFVSHPAPATRERYVVSILAAPSLAAYGGETFSSVYDETLCVHVVPVASATEGHALLARAAGDPATRHARLCHITRDYGMFDRTQAPQHFDAVTQA
jgi:heme-degrading monooxygenase HmoA